MRGPRALRALEGIPMSTPTTSEEPSTDRGQLATVLCASDFSETAELALRHAVALAREHGAALELLHVVEPLPVVPYPIPMEPPVGFDDPGASLREIALQRARAISEALCADGLAAEARVEMGPPGPTIVDVARKLEADAIVVGTRGMTGFRHLLLGSTAEYVARRARCPVLTVHPGDREPDAPIERVVLPTDFSEHADAVVAGFERLFPARLPARPRPTVVLVHADATPPYLEAFQHELLERWHAPDVRREALEERMEPLVQRLAVDGFEVERQVTDGGPVEGILRVAEREQADLIVMGTHGHSALVNVLLGRTAQRVVQHAHCPVLTVPRRAATPRVA